MASATEAQLGGLFEKSQKLTAMLMALREMGYKQPPTPVATDNTAENSIVNITEEKDLESST